MLDQVLINGFTTGCTYALLGVGLNLLFLNGGFLNLGYGCSYVVAAYVFYATMEPSFVGILLGIFVSAVAAIGMALIQERFVYDQLRRSTASTAILLLASLSILIVTQNIISMIFGDQGKSLHGPHLQQGYVLFAARIMPVQIISVVTSIIIWVLTVLALNYTATGKRMRAISSDRELALIVGIKREQVALAGTMISAITATFAAIIAGYDNGLHPAMGFNAVLFGLVTIIVGGTGSIPGCFLGGILVGVSQHLTLLSFPAKWQDVFVFFILIIFLLLRPEGFFGKPLKKAQV